MEQDQNIPSPAIQNPGVNFQRKRDLSFAAHKAVYVIVGALFLLSFGSSVYILSLPSAKKPTTPSVNIVPTTILSPSFTPTPSAVIVTASTSAARLSSTAFSYKGWDIFLSPNGFRFNYPLDWSASDQGQLEPKVPEYIVLKPPNAKQGVIAISVSYSTRTYQEALALDPQQGSQVSVASVSAVRKSNQNSDGTSSITVTVPFKDNKTIILYANKNYEDTFNQILGSFSF